MCGEKLKFGTNVTKNPGSPPRVRGKAEVRHERDQEPGITPACAGKRHCPRFRPGKTRDHPRVCGEKSSLMQMDVGPLGSPPRMRGKGELPKDTKDYFGITPAYAGKRQRRATACTWLRDHPRVCGEKDAICKSCPARQGSPSRMRGKAGWPLCGLPCIGITPAYAGKSQPWRSYSQRRWDHPRVCGEKRPAVDGKRPLRGSPPHVRGKVKDPVPVSALVGITPAYAGKSQPWRSYSQRRWDHPRVCGEKRPAVDGKRPLRGSPPHVRGKVKDPVPVSALVGITPACAGKSLIGCCITGA